MTKTPIGFTEAGKRDFRGWYATITGSPITDAQIQAYFDSSIDGTRLHIEIPAHVTLSGNPVLYILDAESIEFADSSERIRTAA